MVKGVNKTVIEVNNTGSKLFEKIVFYVTPEYGNMSAKQLRRAANAFSFSFEDQKPPVSLRRRTADRRRKRVKFLIIAGAVCIAAVAALIIIL